VNCWNRTQRKRKEILHRLQESRNCNEGRERRRKLNKQFGKHVINDYKYGAQLIIVGNKINKEDTGLDAKNVIFVPSGMKSKIRQN
jgi:hypothetical protein